jgi:hypothetical protein
MSDDKAKEAAASMPALTDEQVARVAALLSLPGGTR